MNSVKILTGLPRIHWYWIDDVILSVLTSFLDSIPKTGSFVVIMGRSLHFYFILMASSSEFTEFVDSVSAVGLYWKSILQNGIYVLKTTLLLNFRFYHVFLKNPSLESFIHRRSQKGIFIWQPRTTELLFYLVSFSWVSFLTLMSKSSMCF